MRKRRAAVVGATGIAGQHALVALGDHPWFEVTALAASARTAGRPYREAIRDRSGARLWWCREEPPDAAEGGMVVGVGRVRPELALANGLKYVALSHNTRLGAAKGLVLVAEYLAHSDLL